MNEQKAIKQLFQLASPFPLSIAAIVILGIASSLAEGFGLSLFIPFLEGMNASGAASLESGLPAQLNRLFGPLSAQWRIVVIPSCIFAAIAFKNILLYINLVLFAWLNSKISHQLRTSIFRQLMAVSNSYLQDQKSGSLLNLLASETWRVSDALERLVKILISSCTVIVFIGLLLMLSWSLTLFVGLALFCISTLVRLLTQQVKKLGQEALHANSNLAVRMCEGLAGMQTIRGFGQENFETKRFDDSSQTVSQVFLKLNRLSMTTSPTFEVLGAMLVLLVLVIGLFFNWVSLPTLLIFVLILYQLQPRIKAIGNDYVALLGLISSVDSVLNFIDQSNKTYVPSGYQSFFSLNHEIQVDQVSFCYSPDQNNVLSHLSLAIPQGKTTAIVGPSGAGKSTLIHLLFRFYDPTTGEIRVDGQPLTQLNLADWRSHIALVSQDIFLFSDTVYHNIAYGRLDATKDEILAAAQQAHAHQFIAELPDGYQTLVGDKGIRLSGGQRQRIALARAIVRNPDILILDEATNALDTLSESLIQEALDIFCRDRTVIAIAHRLSTIENAEQIVVMDAGQIRECGTLSQLLNQQGLFAELYRRQYHHALSNP
ncbi:ABC transporter ATP-binding protein [Acaryochloris marina]|uniref:ABC transporter ATP-binding protein n=1 Tax=Acaryochloris marina TaxID=155978 RepID=UPI001BB0B79F|nr:ABC transporter ATP-binding protein [Acaryochloris marina]QUY42729.1 ABC transporter ATP-binding protein [Acaryochloris marina S15]